MATSTCRDEARATSHMPVLLSLSLQSFTWQFTRIHSCFPSDLAYALSAHPGLYCYASPFGGLFVTTAKHPPCMN